MRDDDNGLSVIAHAAKHVEQFVSLLRRKNCCRLIKDQDLCSPVQDFDDLDSLFLGDRHAVDLLGGIEVKPVFGGQFVNLLLDFLHVQSHGSAKAQNDVLRCCQNIDQFEMLVDHPDPQIKRILGRLDQNFLPVDPDGSFIRKIDPGQHVHQCCLAASVLTEDRKDLSFSEREIDVIVGNDVTESLRYIFQFDYIRLRHEIPLFLAAL